MYRLLRRFLYLGPIHSLVLFCFLIATQGLYGQSGIIGAGFTNGWTNAGDILQMTASAGGSRIITRNASATGNQYFRIVRNGTTEMSPSGSCTPGGDADISSSSSGVIFIANTGPCGNGAWYLNAANTSDNYVFKVPADNSSASFVYFRVQGTVRTVSSVSQNPTTSNVYPGQNVIVTATLSGAFATGQAAYLRYSTNGWASSSVVTMSGSGTTYTGTIPGSAHAASTAVSYYVFTSGTNNVQTDGSNADYFTINLNNNNGPNYSYTVINGWASAADGNWSDPATWAANAVPPTSGMGIVQISSNVTLDQNATMTTLNINSGSLTLAGANTFSVTGTATVASGATLQNNSSLASNISIINLVVSNGGAYIHNATGTGTDGAATDFPGSSSRTFGASSTVTIKKWANGGTAPSALPAIGSPGWGNLTIDVASLNGMWHQYGAITNVQGDLHIISSGGGGREFRLFSENASGNITIEGKVTIDGGRLSLMNGGNCFFCSRNINCTIKGDILINGGIFYLTGTNGFNGFIHFINVYLSGDLTINSPGKLSQLKDVNCIVGFFFAKSSGLQTVNTYSGGIDQAYIGFGVGLSNGSTTNRVYLNTSLEITNTPGTSTIFQVFDNATLEIPGEKYVSGNTAFTLFAGGTLKMGSMNGITSGSTLSGNIRASASRTYNAAAHYVYNGTYNQVTGNGLPTVITGSLTVDNSGSSGDNIVTLTTNNTETISLNLTQGYFAAGTNQTLKISNTGTVNGTGGGDCIYLAANGGNIHLLGNNTVTGASSGHPYFYDVTIGSGIAVSPSTFTNNGTIYHYCTINSEGSVNPAAPTYATGSTLIYNPAGNYNRSIEWGQATAGAPGYPWHVIVQNGTTLNLGSSTPPLLECGGNLTIGIVGGGSGIANMNALAQPLIVKGHLTIGDTTTTGSPTGSLNLSSNIGGDLWLHGNFSRGKNSVYTDNNRAIYFKGSADITVNTPGITITPGVPSQYFSYARIDKDAGTELIILNCPVGIQQEISFIKGIVNSSATNLLVIANANSSAVVGGSNLSYVNGPMKRYTSTAVAGAYAYPVGKSIAVSSYRPFILNTVNSLASGSEFTGEYFYKDPPNAGSDVFLSNLTGIQKNEYWQLDRNTGSTSGKITLPYVNPGSGNWRDAGGSGLSPCPGCYVGVVKRTSSSGAGNWDFTAPTSSLGAAGSPPELLLYSSSGDIISKEVTSFSPFTTGFYYDGILPVQLLEFKGRLAGGDAVLDWKLADISDLQSTELQHSPDGKNFGKLALMANTGSADFSYTHKSLTAGPHFYKLLIREKSGPVKYSQVILLIVGKDQTRIIGLQQNPVKDRLQVQIVSAGRQDATARVVDAQGRVLGQAKTRLENGLNQWMLPAQYLARGAYFVQLRTSDGTIETLRFIKQD